MKKLFILFAILLAYNNINAQCSGQIFLNNQDDVDNFVADYDCTTIDGDLIVGSVSGVTTNITDLSGLSGLTNVTGTLWVIHTIVTNLSGLENLTTVGNNLIICDNHSATDITAVENITGIGGDLMVMQNSILEACCTVPFLLEITTGSLTLFDNGAGCNDIGTLTVACCEGVSGCTNDIANNFDPNAQCDDGSCDYTPICGGGFFDSGGPDNNYGNNEQDTTIICPEIAGEIVSVDFTFFSSENGFDELLIFNGPNTSATPILTPDGNNEWEWDLNDTSPSGTADPVVNGPFISTDPSGCLTFVWNTDGSITREGWEAEITCFTPSSCAIINANITVSDCDNGGTGNDASDDTFTFTIDPTGFLLGTTYNVIDGNSAMIGGGTYGTPSTLGPFPAGGGDIGFMIINGTDATCTFDGIATDPGSCAIPCNITGAIVTVTCDDSGTDSDTSDDTFTFTIDPIGTGFNATYTLSDLSGAVIATGLTYGTTYTSDTFAAGSGDIELVITDDGDATCSFTRLIEDPGSCSPVPSCGSTWFDNGGPNGSYSANAADTTTICPENEGEIVSVTFTYVDIETSSTNGGNNNTGCWDYLTVWNGASTAATNLGNYCGEESGDGGVTGGPAMDLPIGTTFNSTDASGCLTFAFTSDTAVQETGWEATVNCFVPTVGCTNICDTNYDITAIISDPTACSGITTCGCTDPLANNYDASATVDDGSCDYTPVCGGLFADSGGPDGPYSSNEQDTTIICPDVAGEIVSITFTYVDIETTGGSGNNGTGCWDYITVYDGASTTATNLGNYCGEASGDGGVTGGPALDLPIGTNFTSTDASGCLTVVFTSDGSVQETGWEASVNCVNSSTLGCTDPSACNYNAEASIDDGYCDYSCYGCTDPNACNYDSSVIIDNGSCVFAPCNINDGVCDPASYIDPITPPAQTTLCTDGSDGFTLTPPASNLPDISFIIEVNGTITEINDDAAISAANIAFADIVCYTAFAYDLVAINDLLNFAASLCPIVDCDVAFNTPGINQGVADLIAGTNDGVPGLNNLQEALDFAGSFGNPITSIATADIALNALNAQIGGILGNVCYAATQPAVCFEVISCESDVSGCTNPNACNYNALAITEDGTCDFSCYGCTDPTACNYNAEASIDDGSCNADCDSAINLQVVYNQDSCASDYYCVDIQILGVNGANYIGNSSIYLSYDPSVVLFQGSSTFGVGVGSYTSVNFDGDQDSIDEDCEAANGGFDLTPYSDHGYDGLTAGNLLITVVLLNQSIGTAVFACPQIENDWATVATVCFEVQDPDGNPNFDFVGDENGPVTNTLGTNFNPDNNDPADKYNNGTFTGLDTPENELPPCGGIVLALRGFLEGPYEPETNTMTTNLYEQGLLPLSQPYLQEPWICNEECVVESYDLFPENTVDWVLVELRTGEPNQGGLIAGTTLAHTKAGLLLSDGTVVEADGSPLTFEGLTEEKYYIVLRHRNHLDVISSVAVPIDDGMKYDFTSGVQQAFATEQMKDINGKSVLISGDLFGEGVIQITDYDCWAMEPAAVQVYNPNDANLDGVVQVSDYEHWFVNRSKIGCVEICY